MNYNLFILLLVILIIILIINILNSYKKIDNFDNIKRANFNNDGNMTFDYLDDPTYTTKVLNKYYLNDDLKVGGVKVNYHPFELSHQNCNVLGASPYVYGNIWCQRRPGAWNKLNTYGQDIYNWYGVRR